MKSTTSRYTRKGDPVLAEEPLPPGGVRYSHSRTRRMDEALKRGGEIKAIAKRCGVTPSVLRFHIQERLNTGHWTFDAPDGGEVWRYDPEMGKLRFVAASGRLREIKR